MMPSRMKVEWSPVVVELTADPIASSLPVAGLGLGYSMRPATSTL